MGIFKEIFPISRITGSLIIASCAFILCVILSIFDIWSIVNIQEKMQNNSTTEFVLVPNSNYYQETYLAKKMNPKSAELKLKIYIFMLIFHIKGIFINMFLIYTILKKKHKYFIVWLLANSLRVVCVSALLFFLTAVFISQGTKKYQMVAIITLFSTVAYIYIQYRISKYIYDLYLVIKHDASTRFRYKKSESQETINRSLSLSYGTSAMQESQIV